MMVLPYLHHSEDLWLENHKVTFDGVNSLIIVNEGVTSLDVKNDIYSSWKEWLLLPKRDFAKFLPAIRTIGGDPTVAGQFAGDIYFLINGWRLQRNAAVGLFGALFSDDFDTPSISFDGSPISLSVVSSLVTSIKPDLAGAGIPTTPELVEAVWNAMLASYGTPGSAGYALANVSAGANPDTIAIAVWEKLQSAHLTSGTMGAQIDAIRKIVAPLLSLL